MSSPQKFKIGDKIVDTMYPQNIYTITGKYTTSSLITYYDCTKGTLHQSFPCLTVDAYFVLADSLEGIWYRI